MAERKAASRLWNWLTEPLEQRTAPWQDPSASYPDIDSLLYERQRARRPGVAPPTVAEAMSLPAIWRSISLLATATASLDLTEWVTNIGEGTTEKLDVPSTFLRRPQPRWTLGAFLRDTVHHMAGYGESIWKVLMRDAAGFAADVIPVVPYTMRSEWNGIDYRWYSQSPSSGKEVEEDPRNIVHIPLLRDPYTGRGKGPLQACGAAVNVAVEADNWAQRWFVGGMPSLYLDSQMPIDGDEATAVKEQWLADPPNIPKVGYGFTPSSIGWNPEQAQLNGARMFERGEAALMFGIPGRLLEYAESGTSITYANVGDLATELVRLTLAPQYLEPIENAFSDLLPRGHEARFDVEGFQRADIKTRYEVYDKAIALGIQTAEDAAKAEGKVAAPATVQPTPLRQVV